MASHKQDAIMAVPRARFQTPRAMKKTMKAVNKVVPSTARFGAGMTNDANDGSFATRRQSNKKQKRSLERRPFEKFSAGLKFQQVGDRHTRDFAQSFPGQKRLVGRDQNIRKRQQPREDVILKDAAGQIFKEDAFFLLVDIQRHPADMAGLEGFYQGPGVNQFTATGIENDDALFHAGKRVGVEQVNRLWGER